VLSPVAGTLLLVPDQSTEQEAVMAHRSFKAVVPAARLSSSDSNSNTGRRRRRRRRRRRARRRNRSNSNT
jgi:hypothetical protein